MARNLHETLNGNAFSLYCMKDYETDMKPRIQEIRTIIGILFMMGTEPLMKPMKSSILNDEEQY